MLDLENNTVDLNFFRNVIKAIRQSSDSKALIDTFSDNQFNAKTHLLKTINDLDILTKESEVVIFGCWYGSILFPVLAPNVKKITGIDLDDKVLRVAKNILFKNVSNIDFITADIFEKHRVLYTNANLFINTSCEHMRPMNEWPWWNKVGENAHFAFTSNNMDYIEGHVNCVYSLEEFKKQLPSNFEVLHESELVEDRGTKYTLVGKINKP